MAVTFEVYKSVDGKLVTVKSVTVRGDGAGRQFYSGKKFKLKITVYSGCMPLKVGTEVEVVGLGDPRSEDDRFLLIGISGGLLAHVGPWELDDIESVDLVGGIDSSVEHHGDDSDGRGLV